MVQLKVTALVAYALLSLTLSTPAGSRMRNRQVWESPHSRSEFEAWSAGLRAVGFDVSGQALQDSLWTLTNSYLTTRGRLLRPITRLTAQLGFSQSWKMFSNPQTTPSRLWVELDEGAGFAPLFVVGSRKHAWRHEFFDNHRIRKLLGRIGRAGRAAEYGALGRWLARRAAQDFPRAKTLRVSLYTWKTQPPERTYKPISTPEFGRPGGKFTQVKTFDLREFRP
jgi:hypothetical protein